MTLPCWVPRILQAITSTSIGIQLILKQKSVCIAIKRQREENLLQD